MWRRFTEESQRMAFDCSLNILAVEFLIKTNDPDAYSKWIKILYEFDEFDLEMMFISLSLNMYLNNLGEMITQGDYEDQKEILFRYLREKGEK